MRSVGTFGMTALVLLLIVALLPPSAYAVDADGPSEAIPLSFGVPVRGAISPPGDVDWFQFDAVAGARLTIQTFDLSLIMDTFLVLYDTDAARVLAVNDDAGQGPEPLASSISFTIPAAGTYYATVEHFDAALGSGSYSIALTPQPSPALTLQLLDVESLDPVSDAAIELYDVVSYRLLDQVQTAEDGVGSIEILQPGYYLVLLRAKGYHDIGGTVRITSVSVEGPVGMFPIRYDGSVASSAFLLSPSVPGEENTLRISVQNLNDTYPVVVEGVRVQFPWAGLFQGEYQGNITVTLGLPATIQPRGIWNYDYKFTPPSDARSFLSPPENPAHVDLDVEAQAWKVNVFADPVEEIIVNQSLVPVKVDAATQANQGFRAAIRGVARAPVIDPTANARLADLNTKLGDVSSTLGKVSTGIDDSVARLDDVASQLRASNLKLDDLRGTLSSVLTQTNSRLDSLGQQVGTSNVKLDDLRGGLQTFSTETGSRLNALISGMGEINQVLVYSGLGLLGLVAAVLVLVVFGVRYLRRLSTRS